ncbi:hypothetical protein [Oceanisphaera pacifica]|uniref:DUF3995 domain-containing protein n=1 Tax=Oceanisphaera pacifica TaxID=2818389 RepID=A0ABS3NHK5_9GAMM|nr:hypothetical protein [Oceanisphaera pacifica]MBO1519797.1 hypothetical protein [Oceanisphaera pacifica]
MPNSLLVLLSLLFISVGLHGLFTGKVLAGSRGFKNNYYRKQQQPLLFGLFVLFYIAVGVFILWNQLPLR